MADRKDCTRCGTTIPSALPREGPLYRGFARVPRPSGRGGRQKTSERGGTVVTVPAPYTSLRCHQCGFSDVKNRKNQAVFVCQNLTCGWAGNADTNAARNIHLAALKAAREPAPGSGVAGRGALQSLGGAAKRQPKRKAMA